MKDQIFSVLSPYGPQAVLSNPAENPRDHYVGMRPGETAEQALQRASEQYRDKAARLLRWAARIDAALQDSTQYCRACGKPFPKLSADLPVEAKQELERVDRCVACLQASLSKT